MLAPEPNKPFKSVFSEPEGTPSVGPVVKPGDPMPPTPGGEPPTPPTPPAPPETPPAPPAPPASGGEPPVPPAPPGVPGGEPPAPPAPQPPAPAGFDPFNILKSRLTTEQYKYELPEEVVKGVKADGSPITEEDRFDMLLREVYRNTDMEGLVSDGDEFLAEYLRNRKAEGFKREDFIKSYVQDSLDDNRPSRDVLYDYWKEQGYADDAIRESLDKLTKIDIDERAKGVRAYRKQIAEQKRAQLQQETSTKSAQDLKKAIEQESTLLNGVIESFKPLAEIGGLPHGANEQQKFHDYIKYMSLPDESTGQRPINMLLSNGRELYKMLYAYHALQSQMIEDVLSTTKEAVKKGTFEKLDIGPRSKSVGTPQTATPPKKGAFSS